MNAFFLWLIAMTGVLVSFRLQDVETQLKRIADILERK